MTAFIKQNYAKIVFFAALAMALICVMITGVSSVLDNSLLGGDTPTTLADNWFCIRDGERISLPVLSRTEADAVNKPVTFYRQLPKDLPQNSAILLETKNEMLRASIGDETIYEYGFETTSPFGTSFGAVWNEISLPENAAGKTLSLELLPTGGRTAEAPYEVLLGTRSSLFQEFLHRNLFLLHSCVLLLGISLYLFGAALYRRIRRMKDSSRLCYFACFVFLAALWATADGLLFQFLFANKSISYLIFNTSFLLFPIPIAFYVGEVFPRYKTLMHAFGLAGSIYFVLRMILYFSGVFVFEDGLFIIHLFMAVLMAHIIVIAVLERKETEENFLLAGLILLCLYEGVALILFWAMDTLDKNRANYGTGFFGGIFLFVVICVAGHMHNSSKTKKTALLAEYYESCAYTDILTGCKNRGAFERDLAEIQGCLVKYQGIGIIVSDLNYFKKVNDIHGHAVGDALLKSFFKALQQAFEGIGTVYRIGGDEAAVLSINQTRGEMEEAIARFEKLEQDYNESNVIPLDAATGFAVENLRLVEDANTSELFRRADRDMYRNKVAHKNAEEQSF